MKIKIVNQENIIGIDEHGLIFRLNGNGCWHQMSNLEIFKILPQQQFKK